MFWLHNAAATLPTESKWDVETHNDRSELEGTPAGSQRRLESDRQLQLSFLTQIQRSGISHKPQTESEIYFISNSHPCLFFSVPVNCAWIEIILSWGNARQTALLLYTEHWFSLIHCITQKGNPPPPVSRRAVYLPVYRHNTLNILANRGCFRPKQACLEAAELENTAWITYHIRILYQQWHGHNTT